MTELEESEAVEGALAGQVRCHKCYRWREKRRMKDAWPWFAMAGPKRFSCSNKHDCLTVRRQNRAVDKMARIIVGQAVRAQGPLASRGWHTVKP